MVELFRYIEQAFVAPSGRNDSIDVTSDSDFQNSLRSDIAQHVDQSAIRERAEKFLDDRFDAPDTPPFSSVQDTASYTNQLLALPSPTDDDVSGLIETVFDDNAAGIAGSDEFIADKELLNDAIVAVKLTTRFDKVNAGPLVAMRQAMAFVEDFAGGTLSDLTDDDVINSLARPVKVPQVFFQARTDVQAPPSPPPPSPDPTAEHLAELRKEQAALKGAYNTLMGVRPGQLELKTTTTAAERPSIAAHIVRPVDVSTEAELFKNSAPSVLAVSPAIFNRLDPTVKKTIEGELTDTSAASIFNLVDVVKKRWLDVSKEVEPYNVPAPARIYRLGLHVFAIEESTAMMKAPGPEVPLPDFSHAITRPVGIGNLQVVRQELIGYEAGDISHIENVLEGELMRRVTRREETNELTLTQETDTTQTEERDVQSTQRNELATESQKEASQQTVATQDQTTTTSYGKLVENSKTNYARSVTDRAVNSLTQMVKQQRIQREKKVFSEKYLHEFDNREGADEDPGHLPVGRQEIQDAHSELWKATALRCRRARACRISDRFAETGGAA